MSAKKEIRDLVKCKNYYADRAESLAEMLAAEADRQNRMRDEFDDELNAVYSRYNNLLFDFRFAKSEAEVLSRKVDFYKEEMARLERRNAWLRSGRGRLLNLFGLCRHR